MKFLLLAILAMYLFSGCSSTPNTSTALSPNAGTNEVATANLELGIEYMRAGSMEKALEKLNRAYEADRNYHATHNAYGLLYQQLGDPVLAERHFKRAIALNNNDSASKNNYGSFLCQANRYREAEEIFLSAAANPLYSTPEIAYSNAGTCAMMNNNNEVAETYFRKALTLNPETSSALIQMSELSYQQGNYLSARGYLQRYLAVARHTPRSLLLGIRIERELGDKNALASYELLLRNNYPDSVELQQIKEPAER